MKKLMFIVVCVVFFIATTAHAQQTSDYEPDTSAIFNTERTITTPHHYDVVPGTDAWRALKNAPEKRAACYVSAEEASRMTTPALIQTILDYPLIIDAYAYDNHMIGMDAVSTYFPCIDELVARNDATEQLGQYLQEDDGTNPLIALHLDTLMKYITCRNNTSENAEGSMRMYTTTVYTPKGSPVTAFVNMTYADHSTDDPNELPMTYASALSLHYAYLSAYNIISVLAGVNAAYNCHAYAWYSQTSTTYCIAEPDPYIDDASYVASTCAAGRKVTYQHSSSYYDHSGIVDTATSSYSTTKIISKWGVAGLYKHYANDCPYYKSNTTISWWRLNP